MPVADGILIPDRAILEIQKGGPGASNWEGIAILSDVSQYRFGPLDSTELEIKRDVGRDERTGRLRTIKSSRSGNVLSYTGEIETADIATKRFLEQIDGYNSYRVRYFTGEAYNVPTNYERIRLASGAWLKKPKGTFTRDMLNSFEGYESQSESQRRKFPLDIDEVLEIYRLNHSKISGTVTTLAANDVISYGYPRYAGYVPGETDNNPGNKEFIFVTAKDGSNLPHLHYTTGRGAAWVDITLTGLTNFDATGVAKAGDYVVVSGSGAGGGLAYARWTDILAGSATWTRSTNISAGTVINRVRAVSGQKLYAVGQSGAVYVSTDCGKTFTSAGTAVTANHLTRIAVASEDLVWFGGASGTVVRMYRDVMSLVTVSGLAAAVNDLAVPPMRPNEFFIAAADGKVYAAPNGTATTPTFSTRHSESGVSAIDAMAFGGPCGEILFFVETNGSSQSRIAIDYSGGRFGADVLRLGSFTDPANSTINALAAADENTCMAVGDVNGGQGYIGLVA